MVTYAKERIPNVFGNDLIRVWSNVHIQQIIKPVDGAAFRLWSTHSEFSRKFSCSFCFLFQEQRAPHLCCKGTCIGRVFCHSHLPLSRWCQNLCHFHLALWKVNNHTRTLRLTKTKILNQDQSMGKPDWNLLPQGVP